MKAQQLFDVQGDVTFITGGARGMGQAFAEVMAANGARIALYDIDGPALEEAAAALRATGAEVITTQGDVADSAALRAAVDATVAHWGKLDSVFANAGMSAGRGYALSEAGRLEAVDLATWERVLQVNLTSVMVTMQAATPHMKAQKSGKIVNLASIAGRGMSVASGGAYAAAKGGIIALTRKLSFELGPYGVNINAIAPSLTLTERITPHWNQRSPEAQQNQIDSTPLRRVAVASDQAKVICFLASADADFVTGLTIDVTGGQSG